METPVFSSSYLDWQDVTQPMDKTLMRMGSWLKLGGAIGFIGAVGTYALSAYVFSAVAAPWLLGGVGLGLAIYGLGVFTQACGINGAMNHLDGAEARALNADAQGVGGIYYTPQNKNFGRALKEAMKPWQLSL